MKRIYFIFLVALFTAMANAQTVNIVANSHLETDAVTETSPSTFMATNSMLLYKGRGFNSWQTMVFNTDFHLWLTDGTEANTRMIQMNTTVNGDVYNSSSVKNPVIFNGKAYFEANNGVGEYIYTVTGNIGVADTVRVLEHPWESDVFVNNRNDAIIFRTSSTGPFLSWNGTDATATTLPNQLFDDGTGTLVQKVYTYGPSTYLGDKILFYGKYSTDTNTDGKQLFIYDPTDVEGPKLVKKLYGTTSYIKWFGNYGTSVYFIAKNVDGIYTLWVTDGTEVGTTEVAAVRTILGATGEISYSSSSNNATLFDGKVYFEGDDGTNMDQLYVYDIEANTATRLTSLLDATADGSPGAAANFDPTNFAALDGTLYFGGKYEIWKETYSSTQYAIFKINASGAVEVVEESKPLINFGELCAFNGKLYFEANDPEFIDNGDGTFTSSGEELFVFDPNGSSTAIAPVHNQDNIEVFPNPSAGFVNVTGLKGANSSYELYDLSGQLVEKGLVNDNVIDYNVSKGVYLLKVSNNEMTKTIKLVVK